MFKILRSLRAGPLNPGAPPHAEIPPFPRERSVAAVWLALPGGVVSTAHARTNGELAVRLGDSLQAALISMLVAASSLLLLIPRSAGARHAMARIVPLIRGRTVKWWGLTGGIFGGTCLAVQAVAVPGIGLAHFMIIGVGAVDRCSRCR